MHPSIAHLPVLLHKQYVMHLGDKNHIGTCKDVLIFRTAYNYNDFMGDMRAADIFFRFDVDFKPFKQKVKAFFKLLTDEIPCQFYQVEGGVIVRVKNESFFKSHHLLLDFFTIVIRILSVHNVTTKEQFLTELGRFSWGGYQYNSRFLRRSIENFDEFVRIIKLEENQDYLHRFTGSVNLDSGLHNQSPYHKRGEFGNSVQPVELISPKQSLIDFRA